MGKVLIGAVVAGFALFVWGFLFWGISGVPISAMSKTADDAAAGQALLQHFPETGTYYIPGPQNPEDARRAMHEAGPIAFVYFNREGRPEMSASVLIVGFLHGVVFAFLVGFALHLLGTALPGYGDRVKLVAVVGLASSIWGPIGGIIWWYFPADWQLWVVVSDFVSWLILGLVLAYFVRPKPQAA
jgi:hypothetical protein